MNCTTETRIYTRGGWLAKLQEMSLPGFLSHMQPCQPKFFNKNYAYQKMVKIGWPQITLLASDHLKWAHSSALGPFFIPKTRYLWLPYTIQPSCCIFQNRIQGGQIMTFLAPSWLIFSWFSLRKMAGIMYFTDRWFFSPHFSCSVVICRIKSNAI